ncbi:tellurite resistance TerB family protein [Halomonas binhaiensis]|uniref:Tellurite resistance TerB family protein n=1 Tax=Halomonas binhaiensis TaxID=2562282 RepID=A0A5C1NGB5_9GAMM|nr:tellurite resistance TerB family protein [Halomonas binhaiensis]QEM81255.1 tellurite resistance TerB family protein [Halomonas binhaiensis]
MNAKFLLDQLLNQAKGGGKTSSRSGGSSGGFDVGGLIGSVASSLGGAKRGGSSRGAGMGSGMDMKSLLGGGALGMLLGKGGGKTVKYAALAGLGMMAFKAWQRSQGAAATSQPPSSEGQPLENLEGSAQEQRSLSVLQAVIMAARADGHIDAQERQLITEQMGQLGADDELNAWVQRQLEAPLDAQALASQADSPQAAREMYLISYAVVSDENAMERAWLNELGQALGLDESVRKELENQLQAG